MKKIVLFILCIWTFAQPSYGQTDSLTSVDVNDIEVIVKSVHFSPKKDSVTVELLLHSYLKNPRELKINTFATGLINPQGNPVFYDNMTLGRVKINFNDRRNYFNYLLKRNDPVIYTIKTTHWQKTWGKPTYFRMTVEDHSDEGKFLQVDIPL